MSAEKNLPSAGREFERGFGWTLALSTAAHVLILGGLLLVPGVRLEPQPKLQSYSVDLVDPNKLGGTNLIAGSKGKSAAPPKVEPAKAKAPEPPPPPPQAAEPEPPPPPPPDEAKPEPPPPEEAAKPPAPPKEEPQPDEKAIALDRKVEPTPTPVQIAKAEPPTIAPTVPKPIPPTAPPTQPRPRATNTIAKAQATHTAPAKAVAKAKTTPTPAKAAKGQATPTKAPAQAVAKANASPAAKGKASPGPKTAGSPAKAGASPGAKSTPGVDPKARDDRIAAAIKRIEEQAGTRGGGAGGSSGDTPGGPISIGPGEGAGGEVRGVAFIMYTNRLEAMIKEKWVWAGQDPTLRADIAFNILSGGEVVNVRTVASSGDVNYDRRAETAVRAAAPFPPPPAEYQAEFETVGFVYTFEPN